MNDDARSAATSGVFVKTAADARQAARLRREAELLAIANGRGVVTLVAHEGSTPDPVLLTARVDGPDLARVPELPVEEVAGLVAAVATILAELHEAGVVHGAVVPEHVLLPPDGRPVLCGLGFGGRAGEPPLVEAPLPEPAVDPARVPGSPLSPAADVRALGALLDGLLATAARTGGSGADVDALRAVAARTGVADPDLRPSARSVAEAVRHAVPSARLPGHPGRSPLGGSPEGTDVQPDAGDALRALRGRGAATGLRGLKAGGGPPSGRRLATRRAVPVVLAGTALASSVSILLVRATAPAPPEPRAPRIPPPPTAPATVTVSPTAAEPSSSTTLPAPAPDCPAVTGLLAADADGDRCPESLRWEGGVVEGNDRRWSVGRPGDLAVTGDWTCSGRATLAVLRPSTGQVFVFDGWATSGQDLAAPEAARVEGAVALRAAELDGDACADLVVERAASAPATVPVPVRRP